MSLIHLLGLNAPTTHSVPLADPQEQRERHEARVTVLNEVRKAWLLAHHVTEVK